MGRRPRPIELHVLSGRHKRSKREIEARKQAEAALRPAADDLTPPEWLDEAARTVFERVVKAFEAAGVQVLSNADVGVLAVYADATARYAEAARIVQEQGLVLGGKPHPAVRVAELYARIAHQAAGRLGLDPASRAALAKAAGEAAQRDRFSELFEGDDPHAS
ncbi:phage terminase small subunit P27 family [Thermaerobacter sp. FW80]|uniref:phage terminase small subunit P27 family n=1 Tax=Thermaerobacter sp. FW80 TaxID=2546351 RepID=UPI0010750C4D|nr:phage terminase small subunit P27 family [Thermaerobacter sp. FW80]QBS37117.1 phage terminase small subunit P27 family [Thermaerobacter sp. FW80]